MIFSNLPLSPADWKLLDQMGTALKSSSDSQVIKLRPLPGWPFAWLLHPGLTDGLTVADTSSLDHLEEAGLIDINQRSGAQRAGQEIVLTALGRTTFERRSYSGGHDNPSALRGDYSDHRENGGAS